jgi:hypothetical protein
MATASRRMMRRRWRKSIATTTTTTTTLVTTTTTATTATNQNHHRHHHRHHRHRPLLVTHTYTLRYTTRQHTTCTVGKEADDASTTRRRTMTLVILRDCEL